jgi:F0F1-type ATP synthase membrane subunit b/b'
MSTHSGPHEQEALDAAASLPRLEDLPSAADGLDRGRVRDAFEAFRRHVAELEAQLRATRASGSAGEPSGHAVRRDAVHLIQVAAAFADTLERDARRAAEDGLRRAEEQVEGRRRELEARETAVERFRGETERQRIEIVEAARREARDLVGAARAEAEAAAARLHEQAREDAIELASAARAEVEQTLEWARAQADAIVSRAQQAASST